MSVTRNTMEMPAGPVKQTVPQDSIAFAPVKPIVREKSDRRRAPRFSVTTAVCVVDAESGVELQGRVTDLSLSGCYVDTMSPLPGGRPVRVKITHQGKTFEAQARVAYSQQVMGMGVAFVKAEPEQLKTLQEWLSALQAQTK